FVQDVTGTTTIVYSNETPTVDSYQTETGLTPSAGLSNLLLPFTDLIGTLPSSGQTWYKPVDATGGGDGTGPYESSPAPFQGLNNPNVKLVEVEQETGSTSPIVHTALVHDPGSQEQIVHALTGIAANNSTLAGDVSTSLLRGRAAAGAFLVGQGVVDPLD